MKKKGNKGMPTPKYKLIYNPIPTSLFLSDMFLLLDEDIAGTIDSFLNVSMFTQTNNKQRCRDGVMNEFLFWSRHPLVPLLFHEVTSLHPPSFQRNDFSTCMYLYPTVGRCTYRNTRLLRTLVPFYLCTYRNTRLLILRTSVQFYILPHTPRVFRPSRVYVCFRMLQPTAPGF